jgi:hypothetical protein
MMSVVVPVPVVTTAQKGLLSQFQHQRGHFRKEEAMSKQLYALLAPSLPKRLLNSVLFVLLAISVPVMEHGSHKFVSRVNIGQWMIQ